MKGHAFFKGKIRSHIVRNTLATFKAPLQKNNNATLKMVTKVLSLICHKSH